MHCKIKRDNHQVPKIVKYPRIKKNPKKKKSTKNKRVTIAIETE